MATDEELVTAVARGDAQALEELCRRWERPLYRFLHRWTLGRDVEDLYQETWLRIVRAAPRFDPARRFSTWLFQVAINLCRDWHRRMPPPAVDPEQAATAVATGDGMARVDAALDVRRLVAALPEAQRDVVILRYALGLGEAETARVLGCPPGTVKSRLHHAMRRLSALAGLDIARDTEP
jgi:RNA polymerase sigma-70 factor (ECF subfamily)